MEHSLDEETIYSCKELGFHLGLSPETVRRMMLTEPGVLIYRNQGSGKRVYRSIRIPGRVAIRVLNRLVSNRQF